MFKKHFLIFLLSLQKASFSFWTKKYIVPFKTVEHILTSVGIIWFAI